jgi:apolipoprotein N-acyltransferase
MMPPINPEYVQAVRSNPSSAARSFSAFLAYAREQLARLAQDEHATLAFGVGTFVGAEHAHYNSVMAFAPTGDLLPLRYDKIHLVPFGEFMPFKESFPPLYRFFKNFDPNKSEYEATPGRSLTVFPMTDRDGRSWRFVTPICFEDVDSRLVARMLRDEQGGGKRADFIVNATNDGWFETAQLYQHLQLATFRCIENRVPVARSVNTGISGFIDSSGRAHDLLPPHTEGTRVARVNLDRRVTFYTRHGDAFAGGCLTVSAGVLAFALWNGVRKRR